MAAKDLDSGDIKKQDIDDITTCCICTEVYTDPKELPCIHTFCMKCIQETGIKSNKGPGDELSCPICRRLFKIPQEGFLALPTNFFIEKLIQVSKVSDPSTGTKALCSVCLEETMEQEAKEIPTADIYCVDCKHKLCKECCSEHRKFKLTKNHKLLPINEHDSGQSVTTSLAPSTCELHRQRILDVYCTDCKTVVCAICFIDDHKNHDGSDVDKFVDGFRKQIEGNIQAVNECRSKAQTKQAEFLEVKEDIQERVVKLECDVANRKAELRQLIDKHATSVLQGLCSIRQSKLKEIQMATDDVDTYLSSLETYNSYCQKIMAKGSASDICRAFSDLSIRAVELQEQCQPMIESEIQAFNFCFRKSELEEFLKENCDNLIGEIEDSRNKSLNLEEKLKEVQHENEQLMMVQAQEKERLVAELGYKSDPVLVQTIGTNSDKKKKQWFRTAEGKDIRGLTILDKELFVVSTYIMSSEVEVYDAMKFSLSRRWNLKELINPLDTGSCKRNKCLYILNFKGHNQSVEILRVNPNGKLIKKWSTRDQYGCSLSITDELNVILTLYNENKLNEYSPDGQLVREIDLYSEAGILNAWHAVKLTNGDFVVCHGNVFGYLHRVCTVDADGKLKKIFDGKPGSAIGLMNEPVYLSVDRNGFVMVLDRLNSRVLLLDSDLKFKGEIISSKEKHGLRFPRSIVLDESNGRLFVADNEADNQRILIFDFK